MTHTLTIVSCDSVPPCHSLPCFHSRLFELCFIPSFVQHAVKRAYRCKILFLTKPNEHIDALHVCIRTKRIISKFLRWKGEILQKICETTCLGLRYESPWIYRASVVIYINVTLCDIRNIKMFVHV